VNSSNVTVDVTVTVRKDTIVVTFTDGRVETFVGVSSSQIGDGVLRLWWHGATERMVALPLIGIRMWTRELT
jgi:hypothetical protein